MLDVKFKLRPGHTQEREWMTPSPLKTLFWNMTYACNFRCGVCFTDSGETGPGELDTREALDLVDRIGDAGVTDVLISGGEPFMRKDLVPILSRLGKRGITARIATNGSLLNERILKRLREETKVKSFQVSLDTMNPEAYAVLHGASPDTYARVLRNLEMIREAGFHTTVSTRLLPMTVNGIPDILDAAARESWATVTVHCPLHTNRASGAFGQADDVLDLLRPSLERFERLEPRWLVETYIPWAEYHPLFPEFAGRIRFVHRGCRAGRDRLTINPTGKLSPCVCLDVPAAHIGDVRKDDLANVFASAPLCGIFRDPVAHGICADCPHVGRCGGGCRTTAYVLTGRLDGQDAACPLRRSGGFREARP